MPEFLQIKRQGAAGAWRAPVVCGAEALIFVAAGIFAFLLRFDFSIPTNPKANYVHVLRLAIPIWILVKLISFRAFELHRRWARYVSMTDLVHLALSQMVGSVCSMVLLILLVRNPGVPRSVYIIDFIVALMLSVGMRAGIRVAFEMSQAKAAGETRKRTVIYGAGSAGAALARDLRANMVQLYDLCGFVDDDPHKKGLVIHGVKVLGTGAELGALSERRLIDLVLIAVPTATGAQLTRIVECCTAAGILYKTIPGLAELIEEGDLSRQIRDVAVEDLLGRHPVTLDQKAMHAELSGRTIVVTGAAGSIGSEICRQLARFEPAAIVGFEIGESPLFALEMEMRRSFPTVRFEAEIGSIQNRQRLREVFEKYRPAAVYHAAAYKHVPLMESHVFEAVENNVFGTLNLVNTAREFGVPELVMISSDKAVRPTNMMGATKRVAEILVRSLQPEGSRYVSVRFGNVLGSNGSVVPIFKEQIARGGPVTVTHPDMRRFFMTIPEACQLVLQASTMGKGGEIFVLDMGEPVKIVDLARNLILLSGLRPDHDIKIEFSGTRPGEKLYEELNADEEGLLPTHHEKISIFAGATMPWREVELQVSALRRHCSARDVKGLVQAMTEVVPEYTPSADLRERSVRLGA